MWDMPHSAVVCVFSILACASIRAQTPKSKLLFSFERNEDLSHIQVSEARIEQVEGNATDGGYALALSFLKVGEPRVTFPAGAEPWDWRAFGALAMDVFNGDGDAATLVIDVKDGAGGQTGGRIRLKPRASTAVALPLNSPNPLDMGMR